MRDSLPPVVSFPENFLSKFKLHLVTTVTLVQCALRNLKCQLIIEIDMLKSVDVIALATAQRIKNGFSCQLF